MLTMVIFFKRRAGMAVEAFQDHWRTRHAEIISKLPGIRRYVQNHPLPSAYRKGEPPFDAVAESSFDDSQAMKALVGTPQYDAVIADEPNFIERPSMGSIITEGHVVKEGIAGEGAVKSVTLVTHRDGMPIDEFFRYWLESHGALCASLPDFQRYMQCHTRRSIYASGRKPAYDGAALAWFESEQALRDAARSSGFARLREDVDRFIAGDRSPSVLTREHVVLG